MDFDTFYTRIALLIQTSTKTQKTIGIEADVPFATLSRIYTRKALPDLTNAVKLAKYFGVSLDWLLGLDAQIDGLSDDASRFAQLYDKIEESDRIIIQAVLAKYTRPSS